MGKKDNETPRQEPEMLREELADLMSAAAEFASLSIKSGNNYGLTDEALRYLYVAANTVEASPRKIAAMAGVDFKIWYRWHTRPEWKNAVDGMFGSALTDMTLDMIRAVRRAARDRNPDVALKGGRTIADLQGRFVTKVETTHKTESPAEREQRRLLHQRAKETAQNRQHLN